MVGDNAQLPPVGFGLAWHKMSFSTKIPSVNLTKVHRKASDSPSYIAAMNIRNSKDVDFQPLPEERVSKGLYFDEVSPDDFLKKLVQLKNKYPAAQILTPYMSDSMQEGAHKLNLELQEALNPLSKHTKGIYLGSFAIHEGSPVIFTENNYELGVYNGTTGKLESVEVNKTGMQCGLFSTENNEAILQLNLDQMFECGVQLAFAISIHKSQGSEYIHTIICSITNSCMMERSLAYTAITRAKRLCIVLGAQSVFQKAIKLTPKAEQLCVGINL